MTGMDDIGPSSTSGKGAAAAPLVSLRQVAEAAGVSRMTVSRAFKPEAPVKPELRARVLAAADALGYAPDRLVTELMTSFVKRRPVSYRETIAVLWWPQRWAGAKNPHGFVAGMRKGIEAGAARHGCGLEHVVLSGAMNGRSLTRMLKARGITGLIMTPPATAEPRAPELDWGQFCAVCIGSTLQEPSLHRAQPSHYGDMVAVLRAVRARGYGRPCLLVRTDLEERMQRAYAAAFMAWETKGEERIRHARSFAEPGLEAWLRKVRPDVVIGDVDKWRTVLPAPIAAGCFVSLAVEDPSGEVTGNYQNIARVAEGAVDLLVQARLRHETGKPSEPLIMLTTGRWIEGRSLKGKVPAKKGRRPETDGRRPLCDERAGA